MEGAGEGAEGCGLAGGLDGGSRAGWRGGWSWMEAALDGGDRWMRQ